MFHSPPVVTELYLLCRVYGTQFYLKLVDELLNIPVAEKCKTTKA